jgi:hypothetical protein
VRRDRRPVGELHRSGRNLPGELFYADGLGEWITFESSGLDAGGGDPGEVCEPFTVACVDTIIASQAFAAGFVIVGLCWAMARGPKLILDFSRKF